MQSLTFVVVFLISIAYSLSLRSMPRTLQRLQTMSPDRLPASPMTYSTIKTSDSSSRSRITALLAQLGIVTMYKKEGCPYCAKAKALLEEKYQLNIKYVDIESPEREEILSQMRSFSGGRNTVPQIFFNADHLGGNDDVQKLETEGKLKAKVDYVMSTPVTMMQDHWYHPWY